MNNIVSNKKKCKLINIGKSYSPLFYKFIHWIFQDCEEKGINQIYFFTREGEFFYKIANKINSNIKKDILKVSRLSTFCPSLRKVTIKEMMRLWNQYNCQSIQSFCKSLGIDYEELKEVFDRYTLTKNEEICNIYDDLRIKKLFSDKEFITILNEKINNKRKEIIAYLENKDVKNTKGKIAIVDIGWRGTIQDNLCYLLPNKQIHGYYFGLYDFLNEQPKNSFKLGFLNQYPYGLKFIDNPTPLEMLCNSPNGSVTSYENKKAIRKVVNEENIIYEKYTQYIQEGILDDVDIQRDISDKKILKILNSIIFTPNKYTAKAYFELKHNSDFGMGKTVEASSKINFLDVLLCLISKRHHKKFKERIKNSTWNQGYLKVNHLGFLNIYFKQKKL